MILFKNTPYFLKTRKKSALNIKFYNPDYDLRREGAFYACDKLPEENILPLVSVIIRTYQSRIELLKEAVQSVINQTYSAIELIIIEDGSSSAEIFADHIRQKNIFNPLIYLSIKKSGRCAAGNAGLQAASGEYVVFLDDDDLLFADHIEILALKLQENPQMNAVYSAAWQIPTEILQLSPLKYQTKPPMVLYKKIFS